LIRCPTAQHQANIAKDVAKRATTSQRRASTSRALLRHKVRHIRARRLTKGAKISGSIERADRSRLCFRTTQTHQRRLPRKGGCPGFNKRLQKRLDGVELAALFVNASLRCCGLRSSGFFGRASLCNTA
jgi:hypothetical protein